jgi:hypothetical protein
MAMSTPRSSPTGASCSDARSIRTPRCSTCAAGSAVSDAGDQRLAVRPVDLRRVGGVAHVDGGQAPVAGELAAGLERARREGDAVERADPRERALDRGPGRGVRDPAIVDGEDQGRVHAAERGRVRLEEVDRGLRLGTREREVVGGLAGDAGRQDQQHHHGERRREAAPPVQGQAARHAREEQGHRGPDAFGRRRSRARVRRAPPGRAARLGVAG